MKGLYDDIIEMEHHTSPRHPRMSRQSRAAQFAPFAALSGHGEALEKTARIAEERYETVEEEFWD